MRFGLSTALASAAFSLVLSAPASAAEMFSIRPGDSLTYRTGGDYFSYTYFAQSLGIGGDAATATDAQYRLDVVIKDIRSGETVRQGGGAEIATAVTPNRVFGAYSPPNGANTAFDYFFTFSSLSDQTVRITGLEGQTLEFRGPPFPISFTYVPSVPEPAAWLMMIAGFGMIGAVSRAKFRPVVVAA